MFRPKRGFTLIELLIVVAIIGILAAIAIPNFLQAQVRAKIAKVQGEMRNIAQALELYRTDNRDYIPAWYYGLQPAFPEGLTTPIAYLQGYVYLDPFRDPKWAPQWRQYIYKYYADPTNAYLGYADHPKAHSWFLSSYGPDMVYSYIEYFGPYGTSHPTIPQATVYDPTNGTISNGDICRWGP